MRPTPIAITLALLFLPSGAASWAEDGIPIEIEPWHGVEVTPAQLAAIRDWLRSHLHPDDLAGARVTIANREHPGLDYRAIAALASHEVGTYQVTRVVSFKPRAWSRWRDPADESGPEWKIRDTYHVDRVFRWGEVRKVLHVVDSMSYDETWAVLTAVQTGAIDPADDADERSAPSLSDITSVHRDGQEGIVIETTTDPDGLSGRTYRCLLQGARLVIRQVGDWQS